MTGLQRRIQLANKYCKLALKFYDPDNPPEVDSETWLAVTKAIEAAIDPLCQRKELLIEQYPEMPWLKICGFRNRIVHEYDDIDNSIVISILDTAIPELLSWTEKVLKEMQYSETNHFGI